MWIAISFETDKDKIVIEVILVPNAISTPCLKYIYSLQYSLLKILVPNAISTFYVLLWHN